MCREQLYPGKNSAPELNRRAYFCRNYHRHGNQEKKQGIVLAVVLFIGWAHGIGRSYPLALVDVDSAFCIHFFCPGAGYCLTTDC